MSLLLDREVVNHCALVIDANPMSPGVLTQHLRSFGFASVKQCVRLIDARESLEHRQFDLVLCDYNFDNSAESGQDLLEELRREQMLPYSTVFIMVTGEATYAKVAEAAEATLDSYLVKPFSAQSLFERLKEARQRKRVLREIFDAMEVKNFELAAALCLDRFERRQLYWLYAARIGAELLLTLNRNDEAMRLYDAVIAAKTVPWARLGVARVQMADGELMQARQTLETLVADMPEHADSYDLMGKVQMEQGNLAAALGTYRQAAAMTPGCILRLQHCGTLSFYAGETQCATEMLERTWTIGSKSRLFDVLSMMLLALLRFDAKDSKGLAVAQDVMVSFSQRHPQSLRLRRMAGLGTALMLLHERKQVQGLACLRAALDEMPRPDFDMEAATNTLSVWSRLAGTQVPVEEFEDIVNKIARRFTISKASTEIMVAAVQRQELPTAWIRDAHGHVLRLAEQAMTHAVQGQPRAAVETLLHHGQSTGNAKLIEMAALVAHRHKNRIEGVEGLLSAAGELSRRYCAPYTHIAGVRRSNRAAGGMVLRR